MTAWDPDKAVDSNAPEYHGAEPVRSEADDVGLQEFAEEESAPQRAWSRATFIGALDWFASEEADQSTPVAALGPSHLVPRMRWLAIAAGVLACIAIGVTIVFQPTSRVPTQTATSLPVRTVPFVPTALPHVPSEVRPVVPVVTLNRSATAARPSIATIPPPAPEPALVPVPRSVEQQAATPVPLPAPPSPSVPPAPARTAESAPPPARAAEVARAPEPIVTAAPPVDHDEREIRSVLDAYRDSYDRRDVVSTARLWPGVDTAALSRAFGTIAKQQMAFEQCALDVIGQRAIARCSGSLQYVRRVGNSSPQSRSLSWDFDLDRSTGHWLISRVTAQ